MTKSRYRRQNYVLGQNTPLHTAVFLLPTLVESNCWKTNVTTAKHQEI